MRNVMRLGPVAAVAVGILATTTQASALDGPTIVDSTSVRGSDAAVGACNFLFSGPSIDPSSTPFHVEGNATIESARVIASTTIRCRLRLASTHAQVGEALARALPFNNSAVAGDIEVTTFGPFELCTMVNAVYSDDGSEFNPTHAENCRALVQVKAST